MDNKLDKNKFEIIEYMNNGQLDYIKINEFGRIVVLYGNEIIKLYEFLLNERAGNKIELPFKLNTI